VKGNAGIFILQGPITWYGAKANGVAVMAPPAMV